MADKADFPSGSNNQADSRYNGNHGHLREQANRFSTDGY